MIQVRHWWLISFCCPCHLISPVLLSWKGFCWPWHFIWFLSSYAVWIWKKKSKRKKKDNLYTYTKGKHLESCFCFLQFLSGCLALCQNFTLGSFTQWAQLVCYFHSYNNKLLFHSKVVSVKYAGNDFMVKRQVNYILMIIYSNNLFIYLRNGIH